MLDCFAKSSKAKTLTLHAVKSCDYAGWLESRPDTQANWLKTTQFGVDAGGLSLLPDGSGALTGALLVLPDQADLWSISPAASRLPKDTFWRLESDTVSIEDAMLGWALESYRFKALSSRPDHLPKLAVPANKTTKRANQIARSIYLGRDLVNRPANDMGPDELEDAVKAIAEKHGAKLKVVRGKRLEKDFPLIHTVGDGSDRRPRLLDLTWGSTKAPKVTLVGKGVCFDTGGLDIKPASAMLLMKKDMGGAAMTAALADAIMALKLDVRLRLLIPAVENSISGRAFRPGDVIKSRKGITVEIGNTDAEGRLVLADALDLADAEQPDLLIDAATLTGAARVALGPELPVLFSTSDDLASKIVDAGTVLSDPLWCLPLHQPYRDYIKSPVADINNAGAKPFAGSITAALFLQSFVEKTDNWAHLDIFGYRDQARPGRPQGGEATALRPLLKVIEDLADGAVS